MDREDLSGADTGARLFRNPWPALFGGLAANAAACVWFRAAGSQVLPLLLLGLLSSGAAVAIRPRSALVLGLAAVSAWFARLGFGAWDSAQLLTGVLAAVAAFAAVVVLLPRIMRRHHRQRDDCASLCRHFHGCVFCAADARAHELGLGLFLPALFTIHVPQQRLPLLFPGTRTGDPGLVLRAL